MLSPVIVNGEKLSDGGFIKFYASSGTPPGKGGPFGAVGFFVGSASSPTGHGRRDACPTLLKGGNSVGNVSAIFVDIDSLMAYKQQCHLRIRG